MARSKKVLSERALKARLANDGAFYHYFSSLKNIATTSFLWDGFPQTIDKGFLEDMLFKYGLVAVFKEPDIGLLCLPAMSSGNLGVYNDPIHVTAFSENGRFRRVLKRSECVLIYNTNKNLTALDFKNSLAMYAERLKEDQRTEDINIFAQKTPVNVVAPESQVESVLNMIKKVEQNHYVVLGYRGMDPEAFRVLRTDAPFVANQIADHRTRVFNEAMSFLGVSNVSIIKKERVTTDEVNRAMGGAIAFRNVRQAPRERAAEEINEKWGLNVKVSFNEWLFDDTQEKGDEENDFS